MKTGEVQRGIYLKKRELLMTPYEEETAERAARLRQMMNDYIRSMTPQERDRMMQVHLAQARGPMHNAKLLCQMTSILLLARQGALSADRGNSQNLILEVIGLVAEALEAAGIDYAIAGSMASGVHGEPVTTQGVEILVRMNEQQARTFSRTLPARFYHDEESLAEAARSGGFVNVIDMDTAFRVEVSRVPLTPFHRNVFQRRQTLEFEPGGAAFKVVSPEDIILMKLLWRKDTQSVKQWENALSVARVQGARMDWKYLFEQARKVGIEEDLITLRDEDGI